MFELTITIKGVENSYKHKFLVYEDCKFDVNDDVIKSYIAQALAETKIKPEKIKLRANTEVE